MEVVSQPTHLFSEHFQGSTDSAHCMCNQSFFMWCQRSQWSQCKVNEDPVFNIILSNCTYHTTFVSQILGRTVATLFMWRSQVLINCTILRGILSVSEFSNP